MGWAIEVIVHNKNFSTMLKQQGMVTWPKHNTETWKTIIPAGDPSKFTNFVKSKIMLYLFSRPLLHYLHWVKESLRSRDVCGLHVICHVKPSQPSLTIHMTRWSWLVRRVSIRRGRMWAVRGVDVWVIVVVRMVHGVRLRCCLFIVIMKYWNRVIHIVCSIYLCNRSFFLESTS